MLTPRVFETPITPVRRTSYVDDGERKPRTQPYHRASQRELVRESVNRYLHTHAYDRENGR